MRAAGLELGGGFDVVHSHDWLVAAAARRLARRWKVPWLVTVHATEFGRHQGWVKKYPQSHIHGVERRMVRDADGVIACSAYMREHVAGAFGIEPARVRVIPNGIDPTDLQPMADLPRLRAQFARPDEKLVLMVGRLVYEKGFHLALEAMAKLVERPGGVRFLVAGTGTAEGELKAQAEELGLAGHGTFIGWTGDDVLHSLYRIAEASSASCRRSTSRSARRAGGDGLGLPGTIVADTGGLREVVPGDRRVGLRFRARDSCVAHADGGAAAGPTTRSATGSSRRRASTCGAFDWANMARQTAMVYDELRGARV